MRCPSCRAKISPGALSCPACGRLLVAPEQVVEGTVVASSSTPIPIHDTDATTVSVPDERHNRLARRRPRATIIGSLARFAQDAWNEPVVRVAASAALIALGERLADRLAGTDRGRRASVREHAPSAPQHEPRATPQNTNGDRSLVPYTHPGELADRGYVGNVIETIIIIRRTLRRR
ncbi:MAG TPA: zinc ribbon domain-containing protein [Ktedonobacterales bacterium]|jgi:hypothetical protein